MNELTEYIDRLISHVDAMEVIQSLGARNIRDQRSGWIIHSCLIDEFDPHHSNGDNNPSAAIDRKTKRYSCFTYGVIPLQKLLRMALGSEKNVYEFLSGMDQVKEDSIKDKLLDILEEDVTMKNIALDSSILDAYDIECSYLENRGLSKETIFHHGIRYDSKENAVVIPLFEGDNLLGIQRRNINPGKPKYQNSSGFYKESYLYYAGDIKNAKSVVVVESIVSALRLYQLGYTVACTMGSVVFDEQMTKLLRHKQVMVWFDDDYAGIKGVRNFLKKASGLTDVKVVVSDIRGADPADMSDEEILRNLKKAMPAIAAKDFIDRAYEILKLQH